MIESLISRMKTPGVTTVSAWPGLGKIEFSFQLSKELSVSGNLKGGYLLSGMLRRKIFRWFQQNSDVGVTETGNRIGDLLLVKKRKYDRERLYGIITDLRESFGVRYIVIHDIQSAVKGNWQKALRGIRRLAYSLNIHILILSDYPHGYMPECDGLSGIRRIWPKLLSVSDLVIWIFRKFPWHACSSEEREGIIFNLAETDHEGEITSFDKSILYWDSEKNVYVEERNTGNSD